MQADTTGDISLHQQAEAYCKHPLFVVHRIDRPVSGVALFAKTKTAVKGINAQFKTRGIEKTYLAVVSAPPPSPTGHLVHYLLKNTKKNIAQAFDDERPGTEKAELEYELLGSGDRYHFLKINLITGRHHQIRAQLAAIGCIVKGDVKYGARRNNTDRSIHLHAWKLAFDHPVSGERVTLMADLPSGDALWDAFRPLIEQA